MKCKKNVDLIFAYQDNLLTEGEKTEFERHLHACSDCRARLAGIKKIGGLLQGATEPIPNPDWDRSWRKIAVAVTPAPGRTVLFPLPRWALLTAGFLAVFILGVAAARLYFFPARTGMAAAADAPFLYSTGDYFAALQPVLSEYSHVRAPGDGGTIDRERVRLLLSNLRLLRLRADKNRDSSLLRLLDDIELVLLEIAHLDRSDPEKERRLGILIQEKGLPMKMKVLKFAEHKTVRI